MEGDLIKIDNKVIIGEREVLQKYVGIPYKHNGKDLQGLNCWWLLKLIYRDLGFDIWDVNLEEYDENWSKCGDNFFIENYWREWKKVEAPMIFDGLLFKNVEGVAYHCGVYLRDGRFIHCRKQGVIADSLEHPIWKRRFQGFYHLRARDDLN